MRIDEIINKDDDVRIEKSVKQNREYKYVESQKRVTGHTLFSYNTLNHDIKVVELKKSVSIGFNMQPIYKTEVVKEKDCIYIQALNIKNAIKRIKKMGYTI